MSGRLSNLSFNLVDWKIREQILAVTPDQLESLLCALELPPATDHDRRLVKRLDAGEFPEILHPYFVWHGLRVDRRRFARRTVELYELDALYKWDLKRHMLEELAFVSGSRRFYGDLYLVEPVVVLRCCDPDYARLSYGFLEQFTTDAPPFVEFAGVPAMMRAMGGLSPEMEPLDQAYDPTTAAEIAEALEVFSIDSLIVPPRVRFFAEYGGAGIGDEGLIKTWEEEYLGTVDEFVRRAAGDIREIYLQARARRLGVDVCWHSNP